MGEHMHDRQRREFLKLSTLGIFGLQPTVSAIGRWLGVEGLAVESCFDDDFHYFGNNLTNLHFYFINARLQGRFLKQLSSKDKAFMVVKIPQQHVSEQLLREKVFNDDYRDTARRTESKISGFSYLAFELFPFGKAAPDAKGNCVDLERIENLLDWGNSAMYRLRIPKREDYVGVGEMIWDDFKKTDLGQVLDTGIRPAEGYICQLYRSICGKVFQKGAFPMTVLELPEGLLVSPYGRRDDGGTGLKMAVNGIARQRFVYDDGKGKVLRTVEQLWSAKMFFETAGGKASPPLRAVGYVERGGKTEKRADGECPDDPVTYLPTLLDKQELVFLTSLGRKGSSGGEWDIQTRGLTLTGLGAIARFHYKNFSPPVGSSLAEYEHHFTLGRDEYIKVARIGVISVTGQKALHVKIGQRKIRKGVSYMEFREYIEIIQKEINYFSEELFIGGEPNFREPYNFIQARKYPVGNGREGVIHSYDDIYDLNTNTDAGNDVWTDRALWGIVVPGKWNTHYQRWPFVRTTALKAVTPPIITSKNDVLADTVVSCGDCSAGNPLAFWPISETDKSDVALDFMGLDWDGREVRFSSTFMFIRKDLIDKLTDNCVTAIYANFSQGRAERRLIRFVDTEIAYTRAYAASSVGPDGKLGAELPNRSHVARTNFIEYYFALGKEPTGKTLYYRDGTVGLSTEVVRPSSIFNERVFPLFPQVKRAQLYVEHIQGYAPAPLASIIEYHEDVVNYGYERRKLVKDVGPVLYNKAKLLFNHTDCFMSGEDRVLDYVEGKWQARKSDGYREIKKVFSGAGDAIGGLVNPDFDLQSIGLVKQSIAVARDINRKYERVTAFTDKIEQFNPSDLLRQAPEIFNGISLLDILQEVFPNDEAPVNEIKKLAAKIDTVKSELLDNPIYLEIKAELAYVNTMAETYIREMASLQQGIDEGQAELRKLKRRFNADYLIGELDKLVESRVLVYRLAFIEEVNALANLARTKKDALLDYLTAELMAKVEKVYPYYQLLRDAGRVLEEVKALEPALATLVDDYVKAFLKPQQYILIDLAKQQQADILADYATVRARIDALVTGTFDAYVAYSDAIRAEIAAFEAYRAAASSQIQTEYNKYLKSKSYVLEKAKAYKAAAESLKVSKEKVTGLVETLRKEQYRAAYAKVKHLEGDLLKVQDAVLAINELLDTVNLPHLVDLFDKAVLDIRTFEGRLKAEVKVLVDAELAGVRKLVGDKRTALQQFYKDNYDRLCKDFEQLVAKSAVEVAKYTFGVGAERIQGVLLAIGKADADFEAARKKIEDKEKEIEGSLRGLRNKAKAYEQLLKRQVGAAGREMVELIREKVKERERALLEDPQNQQLATAYIKGRELLNILSTFSSQEVNYSWQTASFRNANFGIVAFLASSNPRTSLTVNVRNTVYFQPNRFPAVVDRIESIAENRLQHFGISLLKAIIINFNEVSYVAGTNRKPQFAVKIRDVQFAGAFSFVQALESIFKKLLGDNFSLRISPRQVDMEYLLPIPFLGAPSFGFRDILFKILYTLYFDQKPMEIGVGIGTPANRTKLSVGIYTGLFYFLVIGNPKQGITTIEVSIEFGGYFGLSLGPLRGEVKLVVGLYYRKDPTGVIIEGYFLVEGRVKLWFVTVTARFYMGVRSQGSYVEGRCTVSYEIRLGRFFKRSFSASYYKKMAGATPANGQSGSTQKALAAYERANPALVSTRDYTDKNYADKLLAAKAILTSPLERKVRPLTLGEWETFINSYID